MTSVIQEKLVCAEIEARRRKERLLQLKRKIHGQPPNINEEEKEKQDSENVEDAASPPAEEQIEDSKPTEGQTDELDLSNLAPRKIDWDLKRGIAKSLEILQNQTNEVIAEIVRERMEESEMN